MIKNIGINSEFHSTSTPLPAGYLSLYHTHLAYWCFCGCFAAHIQRILNTAQKITGFPFPSLEEIAKARYISRSLKNE